MGASLIHNSQILIEIVVPFSIELQYSTQSNHVSLVQSVSNGFFRVLTLWYHLHTV